jgi:ribosome-associated protein
MPRADERERSGPASEPAVSKTQRKHAMHALQDLGEALIALDATRLATLDLPERLRDAIEHARTITRHEARRRQLQYIGKLMRDVDPKPIEDALALWSHGPAIERARFAAIERWRERLLDEPDALDDFLSAHVHADSGELRALIDEARAERAQGRPPHRYRALFRAIKDIMDADRRPAEPVRESEA